MENIIFIDDSENILNAIKRMLRPYKDSWHIQYHTEADQVIKSLDEEDIDVLVSDMLMPGMSGLELLEHTKRTHPEVIRITLTGQVDDEMAMMNTIVSHQQISKPCDPKALITTLKRALDLKKLLNNSQLAAVVSKIDIIPSLPKAYQDLIAELNSEQASIDKLSEIMASDVGMSSKVLQLVNSAFFGLPRVIDDPRQAVTYLGVDVISALALSVGIFSQFSGKGDDQDLIESLHAEGLDIRQHCYDLRSYNLVELKAYKYAEISSMLINIGRLLLLNMLPDEFHEIKSRMETDRCSLRKAELDVLGCTNNDIAAYLLSLWGLPEAVIESVQMYSYPEFNEKTEVSSVTVLHMAFAIYMNKRHDIRIDNTIDAEYLNHLELYDVFFDIYRKSGLAENRVKIQ